MTQSTSPASGADREWRSYVERLLPLGERMLGLLANPEDPQLRHELYRHLYSHLAGAYIGLVNASPVSPAFGPCCNEVLNYGFPCPDDVLYTSPLDDTGTYRITGYRGSVRVVDFQIGSGSLIPQGIGVFGPTLDNFDVDSLNIGEDGGFEVILSPVRPARYEGDWWPLKPTSSYVLVRQRAYDWAREVDGRFAIDRLDRPAARPRPGAEEIQALLEHIPKWLEDWTRMPRQWIRNLEAAGIVNKLEVKYYGHTSGVSTQRYVEGLYDIGTDEALIIETEVPEKCRYWGFQLTDELWSTTDKTRQTSLNGLTARLDDDGRFRAVVSGQDPGVPNWLDTTGLNKGMIYGRWTEGSSHPTPSVLRVKLADVRRHLPANTPYVTPAERDEQVRRRRIWSQLRRRW